MLVGNTIARTLKEYLFITAGIFLYCFSWTAFLIPKGIVAGGATGVATVVYFATGFPVSAGYFTLNVILIAVGTIILGKGFGMKTIYSILMATVFLNVLPGLWQTDINDNFINSILGGVISGIGIGIVFLNGGSSGGTDIIAIVISKYRESTPGRVFMICDLVIITSLMLLPDKGFADVVYGYVVMVLFSYSFDMFTIGNKQSVQIMIFSKKYKDIADSINKDMNRGVTALNSVGWYLQEESKVLVVVAKKSQLPDIQRLIKNIDGNAFLTVTSVNSVYGRGFDQIKTGSLKGVWKKEKTTSEGR